MVQSDLERREGGVEKRSGRGGWVRLNLAEIAEPGDIRKRLTTAVLDRLGQQLSQLASDPDLCVLILTGGDGFFSVGADLREIGALTAPTAADFSRRGQETFALLGTAAPVTIAAIDGYCLGGGLDLALGCTFRYATAESIFQHPGSARGIITGWGGTQRLPRLVGPDAARRILLLGEEIDAREALRIGLVTGITTDPFDHAQRMAEQIVARFTRAEIFKLRDESDW